jgi:methyl-accepting chemotaxis protein
MNKLLAYLDRIQGRLLAAFAVVLIGTIVIWYVSWVTLKRFSELAEAISVTQTASDNALRLQSALLEQISAGEQYTTTRDPALVVAFDSLSETLRSKFQEYYTTGQELSDTLISDLRDVDALHKDIEAGYLRARRELQAGNEPMARQHLTELEPKTLQLRAQITALNTKQITRATNAASEMQLTAERRDKLMRMLLGLTIVLAGGFLFWTLKAINKPLTRLVVAANDFGEGNLNVQLDGRMPEEFRVLAGAFTGMADRLRNVVGETVSTAKKIGASASDLSSISEEVAASSGEVSTAMVGITHGAEEQAAGLRSIDEALSDMHKRAEEMEHNSERMSELSDRIRGLAEGKRKDVQRALGTLIEVQDVVRASSREVDELQQFSERITKFVETIQGIASQTNLLALNAAIEAARAGEHGRGFGVVAEEVRKLADGSARAADEVVVTVKFIQKQIAKVVETMSEGANKVTGVEEVSKGAEAAFEDIVAAVAEVREASAHVRQAATENQRAVEGVEATVRQVGQTAESHAASAEQVSAAAEEQSAATQEMSAASVELLQAAEKLKELVAGFRI